MLAIQFDVPGTAEVLHLNDVPRPVPGPGEVLVEFHASSINPADEKIRDGSIAPAAGSAPFTPGYDIVGVVAENGAGAERFAVGTRVIGMRTMALTGRGTWSEFVALDESSIAAAPDGVDAAVAAQLPLAGITAFRAVAALAPTPGSSVLVAGAAGAIGTIAVQLLRHCGVVLHAVVLDPAQAESLPAGWFEEIHIQKPADEAVDGVLDTVGADFSAALRVGGRYVSVVPGSLPPRDASTMQGKKGKFFVAAESGEILDELARQVERGALQLPQPVVFSFEDVHGAHQEFARRSGRRVVIVR